jgi:hypothetical protein
MTRRLAILALLLTALAARAQTVEFRMQERDGWVGSPLVMEIEVQNAADAKAPEIGGTPDFDVRVDPSPRRMEWRQSINGRTTSRSTLVWRVEFTPKREGKFTLPEVVMRSGSQTWRNAPQEVTISSSTASDTLRLEAITDPPNPWVGQSVKLSVRILVRQYTSAQHGVTLDEAQMWRLHDDSGCSWGILEPRIRELAQSNRRPAGTEQVIDGKSWIVYEIEAPFTADRAGPVSLGDLRVAWRYPTSLTVGRDFFGSPELTLSGVRPVTATLAESPIVARALPDAGRPASFRGAVGQFELRVAAKPTQIAVGDPITLSISVVDRSRGGEELKTLQPPPVDAEVLGSAFRVPSDPLAGTVDGAMKTFTQTIRPTTTNVTQIPPIEFSWFDPAKGQYVTTRSQPIDIRVSPSERLANDRIEGATAVPAAARPGASRTEVDGGLVANAAPTAELLRDGRLRLGAGTAIVFGIPPMLAAAALLLRRRRDRMQGDAGLVRALGADRAARESIQQAVDLPTICGALCEFVAARTSRASGTVTRAQAVQLAREAGAEDALCTSLDQLLASGERAAFAPARGGDASNARTQAATLLQSLTRLSWKRRAAEVLEDAA